MLSEKHSVFVILSYRIPRVVPFDPKGGTTLEVSRAERYVLGCLGCEYSVAEE
jgi:hypothetical protein